jgi:hypothetical protein
MTIRRTLGPLIALVLLALAVSACGGAQASAGDSYATKVSSACTSMRKAIEALGKPSDTPIAKIYPGTVKIGHAFVKQLKLLHPPRAQRVRAASMVQQYGYYFDGLAFAYAILTKRGSQAGFIQTAAGADANRDLAVGDARKLGASACVRQPFD